MSSMSLRWGVHLFIAALTCLSSLGADVEQGDLICDNGEYGVDIDLGGEENWNCLSKPFLPKPLYLPAGKEECTSDLPLDSGQSCMQNTLHYEDQPPSHGSYRFLAPKFGDYQYLPPQRWLHTLKLGGVAFLYHPCTHSEQVGQLEELARSCLNQYVLTPYPHLTENYPLAVVTWGCVYRLQWVNPSEVKKWLLARDVQYTEDQEEKIYAKGLKKEAQIQAFTSLCQQGITNPPPGAQTNPPPGVPTNPPPGAPTNPPPAPCSVSNVTRQDPPCVEHAIRTLAQHRKGLTVLIAVFGTMLLGVAAFLAFKVLSAWSRRRSPKHHRYKTVSRHFPFSYEKQSTEVVIPEMGLPKSRAAEIQVLLNESDEDEL